MFGLLLTSGISYGYERAIEAEMADVIEAPMVVADDADASGGQFIWMEGEPRCWWWWRRLGGIHAPYLRTPGYLRTLGQSHRMGWAIATPSG